ncbi:MAG: hypothetical protein CM15mP32_6640 [Flavobacteriaceae bacterium]|nr:MAG: hypothetical protein CM15mP32_6640 [Flavobacteriaceae bacterium]
MSLYLSQTNVRRWCDFHRYGGASTKPGADAVDKKEEINRVIPAINAIKKHAPKAIISIDTTLVSG